MLDQNWIQVTCADRYTNKNYIYREFNHFYIPQLFAFLLRYFFGTREIRADRVRFKLKINFKREIPFLQSSDKNFRQYFISFVPLRKVKNFKSLYLFDII